MYVCVTLTDLSYVNFSFHAGATELLRQATGDCSEDFEENILPASTRMVNAIHDTFKTVQVTEFDFSLLEEKFVIGAGANSTVLCMSYKGESVAVKKMKVAEVTPYFLRSFMQEAILMSRTNHQHVVSLLGTVVAPPSLGLVFEYMNYGSLRDLLCDEEVELTFPLVCQLLSHAADGICFLHSIDIVHRDLKPENMLLNYDSASDVWKLKLTDMGDATQVLTVCKNESLSQASATSGTNMSTGIGTLIYWYTLTWLHISVFFSLSLVLSLSLFLSANPIVGIFGVHCFQCKMLLCFPTFDSNIFFPFLSISVSLRERESVCVCV